MTVRWTWTLLRHQYCDVGADVKRVKPNRTLLVVEATRGNLFLPDLPEISSRLSTIGDMGLLAASRKSIEVYLENHLRCFAAVHSGWIQLRKFNTYLLAVTRHCTTTRNWRTLQGVSIPYLQNICGWALGSSDVCKGTFLTGSPADGFIITFSCFAPVLATAVLPW
jgi:hypothetical protein